MMPACSLVITRTRKSGIADAWHHFFVLLVCAHAAIRIHVVEEHESAAVPVAGLDGVPPSVSD